MEIVIPDPTYSNEFVGQEQFLLEFKKEVLDRLPNSEAEVDSIDVGHGADAPSIIAVIAGAWALFLSGKPILENIDAWKKLGKQFHDFVTEKGALIDCDGAILIALQQIEDDFFAEDKCEVKVMEIKGRSPNLLKRYELEMYPEQLYIIALHNPSKGAYLLIITSRGTLVQKTKLPSLSYWELP